MKTLNKSLDTHKSTRLDLLREIQRITPLKKKRFDDFCNKYKSFTESSFCYEVPLCSNSISSDDESNSDDDDDDDDAVCKEKIHINPRNIAKTTKAVKRKVIGVGNKTTTKRLKADSSQAQHEQKRINSGESSPEDLRKYIEDDMKSSFMQLLVRRNVIWLLNLEFFEEAQEALTREINRLKLHVGEKNMLLYVKTRSKSRCYDKVKVSKSKFKSVLIGRAHSTTLEEFHEWNRKLLQKWDYLTQEIDLEDMLMYSTEVLNRHYESGCDVCRALNKCS